MSSLQSSARKSRSCADKPYTPVGDYTATAVSVDYDPDYADDAMIVVTYRLQDDVGNTFSFSERFVNATDNPRTAEFLDYLQENGVVDGIDGIVGHVERVQLRKQLVHGHTYVNITHREFLT